MDNGKPRKKREYEDELVPLKVPRRTLKLIKLIATFRDIEMGEYVTELVDRYGTPEVRKAAGALIKDKEERKE